MKNAESVAGLHPRVEAALRSERLAGGQRVAQGDRVVERGSNCPSPDRLPPLQVDPTSDSTCPTVVGLPSPREKTVPGPGMSAGAYRRRLPNRRISITLNLHSCRHVSSLHSGPGISGLRPTLYPPVDCSRPPTARPGRRSLAASGRSRNRRRHRTSRDSPAPPAALEGWLVSATWSGTSVAACHAARFACAPCSPRWALLLQNAR